MGSASKKLRAGEQDRPDLAKGTAEVESRPTAPNTDCRIFSPLLHLAVQHAFTIVDEMKRVVGSGAGMTTKEPGFAYALVP